LNVTLPKVEGRLALPIVETHTKTRAQEQRRNPLEQFIAGQCHKVAGATIQFKDFYDRFLESLPPEDANQWSRQKVIRSLPTDTPYGIHSEHKRYVGNLAWEPGEAVGPMLVSVDGRLK
jgi:hypothetical protein